MQKVLQKVFALFIKTNPTRRKIARKSRGQSLVEVAIAFPILIMLFSGVVEFGFIINYYLSLLDATREAARVYSGDDPFCNAITASCAVADGDIDDPDFYYQAAITVQRALNPSLGYTNPSDYKGRRIVLDPARDDVIISVYAARGNDVWLQRDAGVYHLDIDPDTNGVQNGGYTSIFTEEDIKSRRVADAPPAGLLLVEVHYNYHHVLSLPWMTAWLPNPLHLQAYTVMPIRAGEPDP